MATECGNKSHSATFPVALPSWFIRLFTKPGDLVLDPFVGSGTTAVAAQQLGRHFIGIELNPDFCEIARGRLKPQLRRHGNGRNGPARARSTHKEMPLFVLSAENSDEGIFGEEFFEPICQAVSGAQTGAAKGIDFVIETRTAFEAISLKSGPNAFNSSQVSKQNQPFEEIQNSLKATLRRLRKEFIPVMGCGYGRVDSGPTKSRKYHKLAGQAFWEHLTGDSDFYLKLVRLMRDDPDRHRPVFKEAWDRAVNRFVAQFTERFCDADGNIKWDQLVEFNSAKPSHKKS
jgi:hypothetical protein